MKVFYRKLDKYLLVLTFLCFLASCSSSKRIAYFQDLKPGESELFTSLSPHYIKVLPGDKITILINSREPQLAELFNLAITAIAPRRFHFTQNRDAKIGELDCYHRVF